jgi:hypothetical protein
MKRPIEIINSIWILFIGFYYIIQVLKTNDEDKLSGGLTANCPAQGEILIKVITFFVISLIINALQKSSPPGYYEKV